MIERGRSFSNFSSKKDFSHSRKKKDEFREILFLLYYFFILKYKKNIIQIKKNFRDLEFKRI